MPDTDVVALLDLYRHLCRLETDTTELLASLAELAEDELLNASAHLEDDRSGIAELARTLAAIEVEAVTARAGVAQAIESRCTELPSTDALLNLYGTVARAEQDVTELDATVVETQGASALTSIPEMAHLGELLEGVKARLDRDGSIMREIERRLATVLEGE